MTLAIIRIVNFYYLSEKIYVGHFKRIITWNNDAFTPIFPFNAVRNSAWYVGILPAATIEFVIPLCLLAAWGVATRVTVPMATLLSTYYFAVIYSTGKIDHAMHHFILIGMMLSVGACGRTLSIDALVRSTFARQPNVTVSTVRNGLCIRWMWIFLAVGYFFAGFWKIWIRGIDWISGASLTTALYSRWNILDMQPVSFIEQAPWILPIAAVFVILFEMGFIVAIFTRLRLLFVWCGLLFHMAILILMRINFATLMVMYIIFFDVHHVLRRATEAVYRRPLTLHRNPRSRQLYRYLGAVKTLDVFGWVDLVESSSSGKTKFVVNRGNVKHEGVSAMLLLHFYVPLAVFALPAFVLGRRPVNREPVLADRAWQRGLAQAVGVSTCALLLYCGAWRQDGFPFGLYPIFAPAPTDYYNEWVSVIRMPSGAVDTVATQELSSYLGATRTKRSYYMLGFHRRLKQTGNHAMVIDLLREGLETIPEGSVFEIVKIRTPIGPNANPADALTTVLYSHGISTH